MDVGPTITSQLRSRRASIDPQRSL